MKSVLTILSCVVVTLCYTQNGSSAPAQNQAAISNYFNSDENKSISDLLLKADESYEKSKFVRKIVIENEDGTTKEIDTLLPEDWIEKNKNINQALENLYLASLKNIKRIDIVYKKIGILQESKRWNDLSNCILHFVELQKKLDGTWLDAQNNPRKVTEIEYQAFLDNHISLLVEENTARSDIEVQKLCHYLMQELPKYRTPYLAAASVEIKGKTYDEGIAILEKATTEVPDSVPAMKALAEAYIAKKDKPNAIKQLTALAEIGDEETKAFAEEQLKSFTKSK